MAKISTIARDPANVLTLGDAPVYAPVAKVVDGPDPIGGVVDLTAVSDGILALSGAINPRSLGAVGDGEADDTGPIDAAIDLALADDATVNLSGGDYATTYALSAKGVIRGSGPQLSRITRTAGTDHGIDVVEDNVTISGVTVDMQATSGRSGHGVRASGVDGFILRDSEIRDFGAMSDGVERGTGVIVVGGQRPRISDLALFGNPDAEISVGWLFGDTTYGFASHVFAQDFTGSAGIGYAHELKHDARWNNLHALTAANSETALGYGQSTPGFNGAKYNVAVGLLGDGVDLGISTGEGVGNLFIGGVFSTDGAPDDTEVKAGVRFAVGSMQSAAIGVVTFGSHANQYSARLDGTGNYCSVIPHHEANTIVQLDAGSSRNVVEVLHPGARNSIIGTVNDNSGVPMQGEDPNVMYCHATGEYMGSMSGAFSWYVGDPGASFLEEDRFRLANTGNVIFALATPSGANSSAGIRHSIPGNSDAGSFRHVLGAGGRANDSWSLYGWGSGRRYAFEHSAFRPVNADGTISLGSPSSRWAGIHAILPVYADDAAAAAGGLTQGALYITSTGEVRGKL